jgi:hypothetical protein
VSAVAEADPIAEGAARFGAGDVGAAIEIWQAADDAGAGSATLHYDLGNALYVRGDLPRAVAHWRAAHQLRPRDADAMHNLALGRSELRGVPDPAASPVGYLAVATPAEVGALGALFLAVASAGLWRRRASTGVDGAARLPWLVVATVGFALGVASLEGARALRDAPIAVLVDGEVVVRDAARAGAGERFVLPAGTEVTVERDLPPFLLVRTADGQRGWVPAGRALVLTADF